MKPTRDSHLAQNGWEMKTALQNSTGKWQHLDMAIRGYQVDSTGPQPYPYESQFSKCHMSIRRRNYFEPFIKHFYHLETRISLCATFNKKSRPLLRYHVIDQK